MSEDETKNQLRDIVSTLIVNGFHIEKIDRLPHANTIMHIHKYDRLGAKIKYAVLLSNDSVRTNVIDTLLRLPNAYPLMVNDHLKIGECDCRTHKEFYDLFGGIVNPGLVLIPKLNEIMDLLGHNKLPLGLQGKPNDLHEIYISECLSFITESPTRRYGSDRLFENVGDGIVLGKNGFTLYFDSKSYENGYEISADDVKRFAGYVQDFNIRYDHLRAPIFTFIVVSGEFSMTPTSMENKSNDLYKLCRTNLFCITSTELANITTTLKDDPNVRKSIDWRNIFSGYLYDESSLKSEFVRIKKDKVVN